ncbi:MAG: CapA family protein [Bacilli bacterium]|nr:CapA family protein [Bacilli bacterium]
MVGDALLHSSVYNDAYKNGVYDFSSQIELIKPIVSEYDLAFYNQETILGGTEIELSDYPTFNSPQEFGDAMIDAGFNIVNLATNHTLDRGEKAVLNSRAYWKSKDVLTAGSYDSSEDYSKIVIKEKNGIKYTLLSYTYGTNGIAIPEGKDYLVNLYSDEKAKLDIEAVRDKVDVILVSMHWGVEYQDEPTDEQKREAEYLASLGADIIIGTHPHVVQPVTHIGDTLVIYSLGNFISAQSTNNDYNTMVELMSMVDIVKTTKGDESSIKLQNLNNELLYNYYKKGGGKWYDFKVIPFSQMNSSYNNDYKRLYDKYSAVVKRYEDVSINAAG